MKLALFWGIVSVLAAGVLAEMGLPFIAFALGVIAIICFLIVVEISKKDSLW